MRWLLRLLAFMALTVGALWFWLFRPADYPTTPQGWQQATIDDLASAYEIIRDQSPAVVDTEDQPMHSWATAGYEAAQERARAVTNEAGWKATLQAYVNGFGDPHLSFSANRPAAAMQWPGFIVTRVGDRAVLHYRDTNDQNASPVGTEVVSCEGQPIAALLTQRVFNHSLNSAIYADQRRAVTQLFTDRGVPFAPPVKSCEFAPGGVRALSWRAAPQNKADPFWRELETAVLGPKATFGVTTPAAGVTWIGVPSFLPVPETSAQIAAVIGDIRKNADRIRAGRAVVIDVRGNGGGSSAFGEQLAIALWGDTLVKQYQPRESGAVDWRASSANALYTGLASWYLWYQFPERDTAQEWSRTVAPGMLKAVASGQPFFRIGNAQPGPSGGLTTRRPKGPSPFPATVYFLTNGSCASACLDFADIALNIPGTVHIGAPTSGDGMMLEVRWAGLASRRGAVFVPIKVYRGRARGKLEAYQPDIAYSGVWREEDVRSWVMSVVGKHESPSAKP